MRKLVTLGDCFGAGDVYSSLFGGRVRTLLYKEREETIKDAIREGDVVLFGGGEDISPSLYNAKASRYTHASVLPSMRDVMEVSSFKYAQEAKAFCLGICRGAQMLCALSGGKLIQHVNGHGAGHFIMTQDDKKLMTSSVHHQMMWPFDLPADKYEIVGWTSGNRSNIYIMDDDNIRDNVPVEPEIVWFPETKSLGIQGHPEFMDHNAPFVEYTRELIRKFLIGAENVKL